MNELITIIFIIIFFLGLFSEKLLAIFLPIFAFCFPVNLEYLHFNAISLNSFYIILAFVIFYISKKRYECNYYSLKWKNLTIGYFIVIGFLTYLLSILFVSNIFIVSLKNIIFWLLYLFVYLLYFKLFCCEYNKNYILIGFLITAIIQSVVAIGLIYDFNTFSIFYDSNLEDISDYWRATGTFKGPWELGGYLSFSIVFFFVSLTGANKWLKLLILLSIGLCMYALILTYSRASWLLLVTSLFYISLFDRRKMFSIVMSMILIVIIASFVFDLNSILDIIRHRIDYTFNNNLTGGLDDSSLTRIYIWDLIIKNYNWAYFFTGYGIVNAYVAIGATPHNTFLSLLLNGGLVAIIFIIHWFKTLWDISIKISQNNKIFIRALLIGVIAYGLTADIFYNLKVILIMILYTTFAMFYRLSKK